jgi:hypothetical protein
VSKPLKVRTFFYPTGVQPHVSLFAAAPDKPTIAATGITGSYALIVLEGSAFTATCTKAGTGTTPDGWDWKIKGGASVGTTAALTKSPTVGITYQCYAKLVAETSPASNDLLIKVKCKFRSRIKQVPEICMFFG